VVRRWRLAGQAAAGRPEMAQARRPPTLQGRWRRFDSDRKKGLGQRLSGGQKGAGGSAAARHRVEQDILVCALGIGASGPIGARAGRGLALQRGFIRPGVRQGPLDTGFIGETGARPGSFLRTRPAR